MNGGPSAYIPTPIGRNGGIQEQKICGRREDAVGHLVFNNPAKLNAVSLDMWDAFAGILADYEKDPEIHPSAP